MNFPELAGLAVLPHVIFSLFCISKDLLDNAIDAEHEYADGLSWGHGSMLGRQQHDNDFLAANFRRFQIELPHAFGTVGVGQVKLVDGRLTGVG